MHICPNVEQYSLSTVNNLEDYMDSLKELRLSIYKVLKVLTPVCMKSQVGGVVNIAQGKAKCCICHKIVIKSCIATFIQTKWH